MSALLACVGSQNGNVSVERLDLQPLSLSTFLAPQTGRSDAGSVPVKAILPVSINALPSSRPSLTVTDAIPVVSCSFQSLVDQWKLETQHLAESTRTKHEAYLSTLKRYLDFNQDVSALTPSAIRKLRGELAQERAAVTVNDITTKVLRPLFALALEKKCIQNSPLDGLKLLKKAKPIRLQPTWKDAHAIINEVQKNAAGSAELLRFMLCFGVGQAEIKFLLGEHVNVAQEQVHFFRGKTRKEFVVPMFADAKPLVDKLREASRIKTGQKLFEWQNPRKAFASACRRLELPEYELRALRRCFIIRALENGVDPRVVAKWQGHCDAKLILGTYGNHVSAEHERRQIEKLAGIA